MKMNKRQLVQRLESALGRDAVRTSSQELAHYGFDGKEPSVVCLPADVDQVTATLRLCAETDAAVTPWGGGTAIRVGNLPRRFDIALSLNRFDGLVEHDHANLTATVQSGMTLDSLQGPLAQEKQFLAWDAPFPAFSTIGGIVATNLNGPRRNYYGSVRDLVIGMKVVLPTGEQIKAGGKVVKNVAGYDMCKLFVGSLGTLGIITEVTIRVAPFPHDSATLVAYGSLLQTARLAQEISRSVLQPAAVVIVNAAVHGGSHEEWAAAIRTDGFEETVNRQLRESGAMAEREGLRTVILRAPAHDAFWNHVRDFPLQPENLVHRINLPQASAFQAVKAFHEWQADDVSLAIACDTLAGVVWTAIPVSQAGIVKTSSVTDLAREHSGHAILFTAPTECKEGIDVWGPAPPSLTIMNEIKRQFDPQGLLNPGRFIAGI